MFKKLPIAKKKLFEEKITHFDSGSIISGKHSGALIAALCLGFGDIATKF